MQKNWKSKIRNYLESPPAFIRALLFKKLDKEFDPFFKENRWQYNDQLSFGKLKKRIGRK